MSKRKSSTPSKLVGCYSQLEFSLRGGITLPHASKRSKRVSVEFSSSEDDSFIWDNSSKVKKKKLCKKLPQNTVLFGEISFELNECKNLYFELSDFQFYILCYDMNGFPEVRLRVTSNIDKKSVLLKLSTIGDCNLETFSDLFDRSYSWMINTLQEKVLNVTIATTSDKMPLTRAKNVLSLFFPNLCTVTPLQNLKVKTSTLEFFQEIKDYKKDSKNLIDKDVQHEKLIPELRPYQARAVQWMISRECEDLQLQNVNWLESVVEVLKSKYGQNIYYNKYSDIISLQMVEFAKFPKGGILADEMGLGKTVAVICLILNHQLDLNNTSDSGQYLLPYTDVTATTKFIKNSKKASSFNRHIIANNKEQCLNADEKLIYNKVTHGSALKKALTEWYENKLSEVSTVTSKSRQVVVNHIKCVCGSITSHRKELCVECPECKRFQHEKCVGFSQKFVYYCPPCWTKQKLVKSSATLIIAPTSIYHQWFEEINKHVQPNGFKNGIYMYNGLKDGFVQPSVLAKHDIVVTTYSILRAEITHAVLNESERKLRNEERFLKLSSPLRQIQWWRLCLDEAQMVENDCSQVNQMVNLIPSTNRWSVTGTPIQKSINDLYYLVEWLQIEPYSEKSIWNSFLYEPYLFGNKVPLYSVISQIFWRNSKEEVASELAIPDQKVQYHYLKFTAIEQNFYMREHSVTSSNFCEGLRKLRLDLKKSIDSLDKLTLGKVLAPLLNLRQACSHPMAVKGRKIFSKTGNTTLSELLKYLFNKTKVECEEEMRKYIAALNGLASIHCIREDWYNAVECYRKVLQFTEEYREKIHIDSLQQIHTLTNLAEILQQHSEGIPPTLRDDSLLIEAKALEEKYMQNVIADVQSEENILNGLTVKVKNLEEKFETGSDVWWNRLIHLWTIDGSINDLIEKVTTELSTNDPENRKHIDLFLSKISSVKGLEFMLRKWLSDIEENRSKALKHLDILRETHRDELVYHAVDCHLRTFMINNKRKECPLCVCESVLLDYECTLFDVSRKVLKVEYEKILDGAQTKGSWRAHKVEKCLKVLLSVSKSKSECDSWCIKDGKIHVQQLDAMKREFKQIRAVWMSINHEVQACDEISMCKVRLRLRLPGEPIPPKLTNLSLSEHNKIETIFIIEHHEVDAQKLRLLGELDLSKSEFKKKYGTLLYLKNLGQKENPNPDPCPVCKTALENEWCVLQCGHSYCIDCVRIMLTRSSKPCISCPVCRETTKSSDFSFVDLSGAHENSDINVIGDHSTKVDGIVRSLLQLKQDDPKAKVLVFSTWSVVLKILEVALTQNNILYRRMPGHNYQIHLKQFRDPDLNITVLLLPLSWGSKGLNLTEARHVFLVEPIMNPAEELQAIGRVHRIGQTKETVVHRFLIKGTIEEKIHTAVSEAKDKWGQNKVTIEDLKNLFDIKNELVT